MRSVAPEMGSAQREMGLELYKLLSFYRWQHLDDRLDWVTIIVAGHAVRVHNLAEHAVMTTIGWDIGRKSGTSL